ncbi:unnamed protein product [Peronospora belbahrii]|uniref:Uncharacterized protein n=1 Tax=Peronospora belbahrii TaxID=622444 RepID=A0AAU9KQK0_9STRA|nr:unnamed protein product [Peronospora belbahrii]
MQNVHVYDSTVIEALVQQRQSVVRFVCDAIVSAVDKHEASFDQRGRKNLEKFKFTQVKGDAYTLHIPLSMRLHSAFYVGRLKHYWPAILPSSVDSPRAYTAFIYCVVTSSEEAGTSHATPRSLDEERHSILPDVQDAVRIQQLHTKSSQKGLYSLD